MLLFFCSLFKLRIETSADAASLILDCAIPHTLNERAQFGFPVAISQYDRCHVFRTFVVFQFLVMYLTCKYDRSDPADLRRGRHYFRLVVGGVRELCSALALLLRNKVGGQTLAGGTVSLRFLM